MSVEEIYTRAKHVNRMKVTDIEKLMILYSGNVFFRVSIEKGIIQVTLFNFVYKYSYLSIIGEMQKKKKKK